MRARHLADLALFTRVNYVHTDGGCWRYTTRGKKLRTCREHQRLYREKFVMVETRKRRLEEDLGRDSVGEGLRKEREDIVALRLMLALVERLEGGILRETEGGWDWRVGYDEQYAVSDQQTTIAESLSPRFRIRDLA